MAELNQEYIETILQKIKDDGFNAVLVVCNHRVFGSSIETIVGSNNTFNDPQPEPGIIHVMQRVIDTMQTEIDLIDEMQSILVKGLTDDEK